MTEQEIRDALKREPVMPVIVDVWVERCDSLLTIIDSLREQVEVQERIEDGLRGLVTGLTKRTIEVLSAAAKIMHGQGIDSLEVDANILDHLEEWDNLADELDKTEGKLIDAEAKCASMERVVEAAVKWVRIETWIDDASEEDADKAKMALIELASNYDHQRGGKGYE